MGQEDQQGQQPPGAADKKTTQEGRTQTPVTYAAPQYVAQGYAVQGGGRQYVVTNDNVVLDVRQPAPAPVIITNPTLPPTGPVIATSISPQMLYCPNCRKSVLSRVRTSSSFGPFCCWLLFMILLFPFSLICLCCMPFPYRTTIHTCPNCGTGLGTVGGLW